MCRTMERLKEPFPAKDIEWRVQQCGNKNGRMWAQVLAYVTNRAIQERLDEVFGLAGWQNSYESAPEGGILCGLKCKIDGEWITKWDGAENTNIEPVKGGLSGAMKRAAVHWGIGRYLYNLDATFVEVNDQKGGNYINDTKKNVKGFWTPPQLPKWALPNYENKIKTCESIIELEHIWNEMPEEEKANYKNLVGEIKGNILVEIKKEK